jgi:hypothetical protein
VLLVALAALAFSLVTAGNARADDGLPTDLAGAVDTPATDQQASTGQTATSNAGVVQQHPSNLVITVRIDSPGDDGPISQDNVAVGISNGSNDSSTSQAGAPPANGAAAEQSASTDQAADSTATVTQDNAGNVVISIRINSPGNNGPISQSNVAAAVSNAANTSGIAQGGSQGPAESAGSATGSDPRPPVGPPAQGQPPQAETVVPAPAASSGSAPAPAAAPVAKAAAPASHGARQVAAVGGASPVSKPVETQQAQPVRASAATPVASSETPASAERTAAVVASPARTPARSRATHVAHRSMLSHKLRAGAAGLLDTLAPRTPLRAERSSEDVSAAVLLTFVAVIGAFLVFLGSHYLPSMPRLTWSRGR